MPTAVLGEGGHWEDTEGSSGFQLGVGRGRDPSCTSLNQDLLQAKGK